MHGCSKPGTEASWWESTERIHMIDSGGAPEEGAEPQQNANMRTLQLSFYHRAPRN